MNPNPCLGCGEALGDMSPRAKYHGATCRKRVQRGAEVVELPECASARADDCGPVESRTRADLEAADRLETTLGQICLTLARRLDRPGVDTGSAMSSVAGRLDDLMAKATRGTGAASAPQQLQDELAKRRARHA